VFEEYIFSYVLWRLTFDVSKLQKHVICKQQATSKTEKKTTEAGALWLAPRLMTTNRLPFWHFLPVQICAVIHSLGHLFIQPPGEPSQQRNPDTGSRHSVSTH
jgi:hypothetical protein